MESGAKGQVGSKCLSYNSSQDVVHVCREGWLSRPSRCDIWTFCAVTSLMPGGGKYTIAGSFNSDRTSSVLERPATKNSSNNLPFDVSGLHDHNPFRQRPN